MKLEASVRFISKEQGSGVAKISNRPTCDIVEKKNVLFSRNTAGAKQGEGVAAPTLHSVCINISHICSGEATSLQGET